MVGHVLQTRGHLAPPIECRQQVGRGGGTRAAEARGFGQPGARLTALDRAEGFHKDAPEPGRQRQALQVPADMRDAAAGHRAKSRQQIDCRREALRRRTIEPLEAVEIGCGGKDGQYRRRQIDAVDVCLAVWPQAIAGIPEPPREAGTESRGAAGALVGAIERDALGRQGIDGATGVVARDFLEPGIDHRRHSRDGQRRFRDVGGDDHPPAIRRLQHRILLVSLQGSVQWHERDAVADGHRRRARDGIFDLPHARKEAQHVAWCPRQHLVYRLGHRLRRGVLERQRMQRAWHIDDRAVTEECRHRGGVERRRHDQDAEIVARLPRLFRKREPEVGVHAALVKLIQDERGDITQQRVPLQVRGQDAFRDDEQARVLRESALETDVPADLVAN